MSFGRRGLDFKLIAIWPIETIWSTTNNSETTICLIYIIKNDVKLKLLQVASAFNVGFFAKKKTEKKQIIIYRLEV